MFSTIGNNESFIGLILYIIVAIFVLFRLRGFSNLFRFSLRYLKIEFTDEALKRLDDNWYNVQLFKVMNNINVSNLKDARSVQGYLNQGSLKPSLFVSAGSWGDVVRKVTLKYIIMTYMAGFFLMGTGAAAWDFQNKIVPDYAKIYYKDFTFYISLDKLFITSNNMLPDEGNAISRQDCTEGLKLVKNDSAYSIACQKFLGNKDSYKWWLDNEIHKVNQAKRTFSIIGWLYVILSVLWLFSFTQFLCANHAVRKLMLESENRQ